MCDSQPATVGEAVAAVTAGLAYLARTDAASLGTAGQAECLRALEKAEAVHTAARVNVLAAFHTSGGCEPDGSGSTQAWLAWQTKITRSAAAGAVGWMRRLREHSAVWEALAAGTVSASWARRICDWTDRLPEASRGNADAILLGAAGGGAGLRDLAALAEEMYQRSRPPDGKRDMFEDRALYFAKTFGFAGRLEADLTPAASAALQAVLDSLGTKLGPEDTRSQRQRWHDALEEACVRLIGAGMLPERAGQPVHLQLQITLDQLRQLAAGRQVETAWAARAGASGLTGCWRQPAACHVHHLTHRQDGGPTSLANCYLVCRFHHLIAIHRWGWKLTAHPDGTTTATHPNGRTLHSHPPPSQAA